ncbi:alpha/beta hydrolase [Bradyrhizobium jicamae]|uniref:Alpha/beta hydrolase n=1 Tax=Bradyrhizobium jicamae TaxID=280332 RepID=A0ABS5FUU0_9BRAD|nr:alpha/beta hydrolase [Bradyrhizobium jicamae]MBR0800516.1 alpha/beta hydrolase [Bradyrhizobium jicamae]MBR0938308.1 alpha/beta hydrolase [Bradyrhizobium jicamae]
MHLNPLFCLAALAAVVLGWSDAHAQPVDQPAYGPELQGFEYPYPVAHYHFTSQGQELDMAYLDVKPQAPNGQTAVLLHGKNFCAATWQGSIKALSDAGYRVIAPDQIGFCKSSKPEGYQFTFQQLAGNSRALLASLGIEHSIVIGHSTGGMLAMRYALMYPNAVDRLVLVDPIGLEDWKAKGVPWLSLDGWMQREARVTADGIRAYERATYYADTWDPSYETWVQMLAGMYRGPGRAAVSSSSARIYDMIATQPVFYEFEQIAPPTLLLIGDKDTTAIGKDTAPPEIRKTLGNYPVLGKEAAKRIPHAQLVEFPDLGHSPQIQAPARFHAVLLGWLENPQTGVPQVK